MCCTVPIWHVIVTFTKKLVRFYCELAVSDNTSIASYCCVMGILPCYYREFLLQVKESNT